MRKILVIDDNQGNLASLKATIENSIPDCQILLSESGSEGIKLAKTEQPNIILLDVVMPKMDGYTTCRKLKAGKETKHIHVILISTFRTDSDSKVQGYQAGADAYISRPIEREELAAQISSLLRITETERLLKSALEKATESDRLKSAFLASMTHELRTPLNAIIGFSGLLTSNTPANEAEKFAQTIHKNGNHLLKLVEDIFDITLIETGEVKIDNEEQNIRILLADLLEIAQAEQVLLEKHPINIRINPMNQINDFDLYTDHFRLKQIMINLLKNAIKFTQTGTIEFGYSKETLNNQQSIQFYVRDTGIGISEEKHEIIFDLFRQGDDSDSRAHSGAGIGLSVSKKLTELLGGKMWVESSEGVGSMFYFTVPIRVKHEIEKEVGLEPVNHIDFNGKNLLIVEDIDSSYEFLDHLLRDSGAQTIRASDGEQALKICRENPALDLVLMDIQMPVMNGYEATKKIKKIRPELPVIAQTAYAMAGDMNKSMEAGCDGYISKPIRKEELFRLLRKVLLPQEGLKAS